MMKQFKKLTLVATAAFLFCLTSASGTLKPLPVPSITIDEEEEAKPTPLPEKPGIKPMADDEDESKDYRTK